MFHRSLHRQAVVRFTLGSSSHFGNTLSGTGEITLEGQTSQSICVSRFSLGDKSSGRYRTSLTLDRRAGEAKDEISGFFAGSFQDGSLSIQREDTDGYQMKGVLKHGTDTEYATLVQQLPLHGTAPAGGP